jgi:hypothetical protein
MTHPQVGRARARMVQTDLFRFAAGNCFLDAISLPIRIPHAVGCKCEPVSSGYISRIERFSDLWRVLHRSPLALIAPRMPAPDQRLLEGYP